MGKQNAMTIYLAVTSLHYTGYEMLKGADILSSYFYCRSIPEITDTIPQMRDFMLDSGVFSFINSGKKFDERYIREYAEYIRANKIKSYVELDVDQIIGVKETRKLRDKLEAMVGWPSIPVWHTIRGKEAFLQDARDYPRICLGYYLTEGLPTALTEKFTPWFIDKAHENDCKLHGLGFTKTNLLPKFPFDSVDSSTWSFGQRSGASFFFNPERRRMEQRGKKQGVRISDYSGLMKHNFAEWRKYQDWARNYLPTIN
jgi:hypothetical protein